jgi:ERO1-like protein beta
LTIIQVCCPPLIGIGVEYLFAEGDYYDLSLVPERFTGYSGPDSHRVWHAIYEENCFGLSELNLMKGKSPALVSLPDTMSEIIRDNGDEHEGHCLEKRVYYKIISGKRQPGDLGWYWTDTIIEGLHASISTHICWEYLDQRNGQWVRLWKHFQKPC